ncbi:Potassium voltage-gated channel subfamily KQT; possible potassium channel, VIC family [hydrothermal vent metagenome]|uniref:BK channel n=1 Tax=hydrothermal vent metagenome TaxID=652676 RepID=A0A3B1BLW0_9ZZZZ
MKQTVFEILEGTSRHQKISNAITAFIMSIVVLSCIAIVIETVEPLSVKFFNALELFEYFSITIFTVEYVFRVWACVESPKYSHPLFGRIRFMLSPMALVDLLAILPFYLTFVVADLRFIRALRLLRIFRIFKIARYSKALMTFGRILASKKEELVITAILGLILIFFSSSFMYFIEHDAQPEAFASIPHAMWWAVVTLTTVGYGDIYPITMPGKLLGGFIAIIGIGMFALPAGILGSAFVLEEMFGHRRVSMKNHFVLCGLGKIGIQVMKQLKLFNKDVIVVEKDKSNPLLQTAYDMGVTKVIGDIRMEETLNQAFIHDAQCLIAVSNDDLSNLEAALNARKAKKDIHIVLRVLDHNLAEKIQTGFGIESSFSPSALAAPAFAMAAIDPSVIGSFYVGDDLMLNMELVIKKGAPLDGMTTVDFENMGAMSILAYENAATGKRMLHISESIVLKAGDKLVLSTVPDMRHRIHEINKPA